MTDHNTMPSLVRAPRPWLAIGALVGAGALLALLGRISGVLAVRTGSPVVAALVIYTVGGAGLLLVVASSRRARSAATRRPAAPVRWYWWLGGVVGASVPAVLAVGVPIVGVALVSVCLIAGAITGGLLVDRVGLGPGGRRPFTAARLTGAGLALLAIGLGLLGNGRGHARPALLLAVAAVGFASAGQQAVNGQLTRAIGDARVVALVSFLVSAVALGTLSGLLLVTGELPGLAWPAPGWLYAGGLIAALFSVLAAATVGRVGVLRLALAGVGGQLLGAMVLDVVAPMADRGLRPTTVLGAALTLLAVAISGAGDDVRATAA